MDIRFYVHPLWCVLVRSGVGDYIINVARAAAGKSSEGRVSLLCLAWPNGLCVGIQRGEYRVDRGDQYSVDAKAGFPSRFAAGVEAAASTGGQLMPPVMGAGAFIMASYTQIPYVDIIAVSFVPALIYFLSVAFLCVSKRSEAACRKLQPVTNRLSKFW